MKSPDLPIWAFLSILHVPRLISEQCSTGLIRPGKQSNQPYGLKNRLQKPLFSGSGSTCSGIGIRLFSITQFSVASCTSVKPYQSAFKYSITSVLYKPFTVSAKALSYESPVVPTDARKFAASKQ